MSEIAIIMTLHNRERFVEAAVRSVLTQSWADFTLHVVDDASSDSGPQIVERLAASDARVRLHREPRRGLVGTLRRAHEHALADPTVRYVGWVDSDDLLVRTALEETRAALESDARAGLVFTDHVRIDEHSRPLPGPSASTRACTPDALLTELLSFQFRLFRREVWERLEREEPWRGAIDASLTASPDYDFCLRASEVTPFVHVARPLYCYRQHAGQVSNARRVEQIENSARAVREALRRRGLSDRYELKVTLISRFEIAERRQRPTDG